MLTRKATETTDKHWHLHRFPIAEELEQVDRFRLGGAVEEEQVVHHTGQRDQVFLKHSPTPWVRLAHVDRMSHLRESEGTRD